LSALAFAVAAVSFASPASAQATRTWVSGVGDDVNPCSRTAPCKTFAGAISKTAAGGEINCLDPGGYGAVTITKSMTISCLYTEGGVLAGGNGITVNAAATDVVFLRGLDIFGVNPPTNGVRIVNAGAVHIEDSVIRRFNSAGSFGVSFQPSGATQLFIRNTTIAENGNSGGTGGGILVQPTGAAGSSRVQLNNVRVLNNAGVGLKIDSTGATAAGGSAVVIDNSEFSGSPIGISAIQPSGTSAISVMLDDSIVTNNSIYGLAASGAGTAIIRVSGTMITANATAILNSGGGTVRSYGDNLIDGNTNPSTFSGAVLPKS
jgi:hypothetical protein